MTVLGSAFHAASVGVNLGSALGLGDAGEADLVFWVTVFLSGLCSFSAVANPFVLAPCALSFNRMSIMVRVLGGW